MKRLFTAILFFEEDYLKILFSIYDLESPMTITKLLSNIMLALSETIKKY